MAAGFTLLRFSITFGLLSQVATVPRNVFRDKTGLCKRYGMACPVDKTCMVQRIDRPRAMRLPVCVSAKFAPAHMKACYQPPERGPCAAEFIRWHYNVQANQCSWFYFGGCGGNRNNFFSKEGCERACMGDTVATRKESPDNVKDLPKSISQRRAEEFLSRPKPEFEELRSQIETVINGRPKSKSRKHRNGKGRRRYRNRTQRVVFADRADDQWPHSYRKTMRRGELFKLFSVLNRGHFRKTY